MFRKPAELYHIQGMDSSHGTTPCQIVYGRYLLPLDNRTRLMRTRIVCTTNIKSPQWWQSLEDEEEKNAKDQDPLASWGAETKAPMPFHANVKCGLCKAGARRVVSRPARGHVSHGGRYCHNYKELDCQAVMNLYAKQSPDTCLNYASAGLRMERMLLRHGNEVSRLVL